MCWYILDGGQLLDVVIEGRLYNGGLCLTWFFFSPWIFVSSIGRVCNPTCDISCKVHSQWWIVCVIFVVWNVWQAQWEQVLAECMMKGKQKWAECMTGDSDGQEVCLGKGTIYFFKESEHRAVLSPLLHFEWRHSDLYLLCYIVWTLPCNLCLKRFGVCA